MQLSSSVTGTPRLYATAAQLDEETMHGRIWLGLHFRRAMTDGNLLGHLVAEQVQSALVPTSGRGHRAG